VLRLFVPIISCWIALRVEPIGFAKVRRKWMRQLRKEAFRVRVSWNQCEGGRTPAAPSLHLWRPDGPAPEPQAQVAARICRRPSL